MSRHTMIVRQAGWGFSLALAIGIGAVAAQDPPGTPASKAQRLTFDVLDRNADRKISAEEFRNTMAAVEGQDRNLDGTVTRREVEFLEFAMGVFDGIDTNADGFVTPDESQAAVAKVKAAQAGR